MVNVGKALNSEHSLNVNISGKKRSFISPFSVQIMSYLGASDRSTKKNGRTLPSIILVYSLGYKSSCLMYLVYSVGYNGSCLMCLVYSVGCKGSCLMCMVYSFGYKGSCLICMVYSLGYKGSCLIRSMYFVKYRVAVLCVRCILFDIRVV